MLQNKNLEALKEAASLKVKQAADQKVLAEATGNKDLTVEEAAVIMEVAEEQKTGGKEAYQDFIQEKLKAKGHDSLNDLSDEETETFFNAVEKEWESDDEREEAGVEVALSEGQKAYRAFFDGKLKAAGVSSPSELDGPAKTAFFNDIKKSWKGGSSEEAEVEVETASTKRFIPNLEKLPAAITTEYINVDTVTVSSRSRKTSASVAKTFIKKYGPLSDAIGSEMDYGDKPRVTENEDPKSAAKKMFAVFSKLGLKLIDASSPKEGYYAFSSKTKSGSIITMSVESEEEAFYVEFYLHADKSEAEVETAEFEVRSGGQCRINGKKAFFDKEESDGGLSFKMGGHPVTYMPGQMQKLRKDTYQVRIGVDASVAEHVSSIQEGLKSVASLVRQIVSAKPGHTVKAYAQGDDAPTLNDMAFKVALAESALHELAEALEIEVESAEVKKLNALVESQLTSAGVEVAGTDRSVLALIHRLAKALKIDMRGADAQAIHRAYTAPNTKVKIRSLQAVMDSVKGVKLITDLNKFNIEDYLANPETLVRG